MFGFGKKRPSLTKEEKKRQKAVEEKVSRALWEIENSPEEEVNLDGLGLYSISIDLIKAISNGMKKNLVLSNNHLKDINDKCSLMHSLRYLDLKHNQIESLPESLLTLTNLRQLNLEGNLLRKLPSKLDLLVGLEVLLLSKNHLTEIPICLANLPKLTSLDVTANPSLMIPDKVTSGGCQSIMQYWADSGVSYQGPLQLKTKTPNSDAQIASIKPAETNAKITKEEFEKILWTMEQSPDEIVCLSSFNLENVPSLLFEVCSTGCKKKLYLNNNRIKHLPDVSYYKFKRLQFIDLSHNRLKSLPLRLSALEELQTLILEGNEFCEVPPCITRLNVLVELNMNANKLVDLPNDLARLRYLQTFKFENNPQLIRKHEVFAVCSFRELMTHLASEGGFKYREPLSVPTEYNPQYERRKQAATAVLQIYNESHIAESEEHRLMRQSKDLKLRIKDIQGELIALSRMELTGKNEDRTREEKMTELANLMELAESVDRNEPQFIQEVIELTAPIIQEPALEIHDSATTSEVTEKLVSNDESSASSKRFVVLLQSIGLEHHVDKVKTHNLQINRYISDFELEEIGFEESERKLLVGALDTLKRSEAATQKKTREIEESQQPTEVPLWEVSAIEEVCIQDLSRTSEISSIHEVPVSGSSDQSQHYDGKSECIVCIDKKINIVLIPCGHAAVCEACSKSLCVCPICRADITQRMKIYIS